MEASGHARWSERLMAELNIELWIGACSGDPQPTSTQAEGHREDARLILHLLLEDRFPRIWVPSWENRTYHK
jgi:hypothetical protein